ncbi:hypothetical protein NPX13_g1185 [Xylaria arbuscula]|uniref:Ankyrin repeat protein n=1 Tax=Xylaria arbuscula TaxID=114810 RepID=A0A9W8TRI9_9PEZI|nr:hypothetical protein NPX13_g1185 [Xylaria arbuscula]
MPGHKKHVDNHGQTLFAKACAKGEYETAKKRLAERPEDLNFADYAGNTPLQVASLNGHEDIVQLLIEAGCNLDCRNSDKETPLLDAVENGHLAVVKLLLKAGVNPRKADAEGHEPLEKVPDDLENAEEIRAALREAKERVGEKRRTSEDHQPQDVHDTLSSHGPDSPRDSSVAPIGSLLAEKRRGGTVRSTKTSNHLLYMNLDDKTLRQAAARGDNETVTRVLQVKERCDDPEALVNAARGGHNVVVELLLALGGANPDPRPVSGLPIEHGTPMLAAIGQENIEVIKLLLNANGFNPTRQYKGQTYYEIARRREGPNWKEEEHILKEAYDHFKKGSKGSSKSKPSPNRREREFDQDSRRSNRAELALDAPRLQKRRTSASPPRDAEPKKKLNTTKAAKSPREKRRSLSFGTQDENTSPKRGPGRPKRDERGSNTASSDREISPVRSKNVAMPKLVEPDVAGSSDGEAIKPRRKLISGKDLNRQRERQRRESLASNISGIDRGESKADEPSEKPRGDREKHLSRTKALKREESTERLSTTDASGKRHRSSASPSRRGLGDKEDSGAPVKRRKLDSDAKDRRYLEPPSPESRHTKRDLSRDSLHRQRHPDNDRREISKAVKLARDHREPEKTCNSDKSITVASEDPDVEMRDSIQVSEEEGEIPTHSEKEETKKQRKKTPLESSVHDELRRKEAEQELQERGRRKQEEETKRKEQEAEKKRLEAEERSRLELEDLKRKEAAEKARLEEEKRVKEEEERKKKEREEQRLREEQEHRQREEEERRQREEREERERQQREEEQRRQEEQQRLQREEEKRIQREEEERIQREREAAEEARRLREEEERRERERKEAERIAREQELQRVEQERIRVSKLPPLLRWLDGCSNPKQKEIAELFVKAQGVRYDTIDPSTTGKAGGRDQWLLSTQVALLLGEKDLSLSHYPLSQRVPASKIAKTVIWRLEQDRYALTESKLYHLGEQLADFYGGDPRTVGYKKLEQIRGEAANLFLETDMFFVKETDFLNIIPSIPHLQDLRLSICYRELPENEAALFTFSGPSKWKQDPDAASRGPFAPRNKFYINGQLIGEEKPGKYRPSREPFPEHRVPRRHGLVKVTPDEPDYARLCVEQNLAYLLTEQQKQSVLTHLTPKSMASNEPTEYAGDNVSPSNASPQGYLVNGFRRNPESPGRLPNGISGTHHEHHDEQH